MHSSFWRIVIGIVVFLFGAAIVYRAITADWEKVALLTVFLVGSVAFLWIGKRLPMSIRAFVVVAVLGNAIGYTWDLYQRFAPFDKIIHGYTLFALTAPISLWARRRLFEGMDKHPFWAIITMTSYGIALGALWEVAEWAYDLFEPLNVIKGKTDTITDIIVDTLGAVCAAFLILYFLKDDREK
jgi:VanZ family protein